MVDPEKKPDWIRVRAPGGEEWKKVQSIIDQRGLHTVCDEAKCPNKGECWGMGTATFMILGDVCTRHCRFCGVSTAKTGRTVPDTEAVELAQAVKELDLSYVVLTSVDRDDLPDRGSNHFARCISVIKEINTICKVEALIPDYFGDELLAVINAMPETIAHNVETVRSLQQNIRDSRASFDKSLRTLSEVKNIRPDILTKSSLLLGLGETEDEILSVMDDLRTAKVDILVMGQYLQPSKKQIPVQEYINPDIFTRLKNIALEKDFSYVISSPLARTSYHAHTAYLQRP
ncbi:MAG: lipoyl synthase [Treponema sp.]|nr:lipoyl synthase [Treponema sp.]